MYPANNVYQEALSFGNRSYRERDKDGQSTSSHKLPMFYNKSLSYASDEYSVHNKFSKTFRNGDLQQSGSFDNIKLDTLSTWNKYNQQSSYYNCRFRSRGGSQHYSPNSRGRNNYNDDMSSYLNDDIYYVYNRYLLDIQQDCYDKKFCFYKRLEYEIKSNEILQESIWTIKELDFLKTDLNCVKDQLNNFDSNEWHKHTRLINPALNIVRHLQENVRGEFVTQAWCKFYEVAYTYLMEPIKSIDKELYTVHLCEAPGAFVSSLNHFLKTNFPNIQWKWMASSLNPFYEGNDLSSMINEDKLILNTQDNWDFGRDQTGNIFSPDYVQHLRSELTRRSFTADKLLLVTADGSFDCQDNPDEQESDVMYLLFIESLFALTILGKNGNFVLKTFTMFECNTVCLIYLLYCAFDKVNVFKPCTSKEGNSETYVICTGYKGLENVQSIVDLLFDNIYRNKETFQEKAVFPLESIPDDFLIDIKACSDKFTKLQMSIIKRNIALFPKRQQINPRAIKKVQTTVYRKYVERYSVQMLDEKNKLIHRVKIENNVKIIEPRTAVVGSFTERKLKALQHVNVRVEDIESELNSALSYVNKSNADAPKFLTHENVTKKCCTLPIFGKPVINVKSSQFCYSGFIRLQNKVMAISSSGIIKRNRENDSTILTCNEDRTKTILHNFHKIYTNNNNDEAQNITTKHLLDLFLQHVKIGDTLVLKGLPLLTHYNVSLIYLLCGAFSQIKYQEPDELIFSNCLYIDYVLVMLKAMPRFHNYYKSEFSILSFVPMQYLRGNVFYSWIVRVNNLYMAAQIRDFIQKIRHFNKIRDYLLR